MFEEKIYVIKNKKKTWFNSLFFVGEKQMTWNYCAWKKALIIVKLLLESIQVMSAPPLMRYRTIPNVNSQA